MKIRKLIFGQQESVLDRHLANFYPNPLFFDLCVFKFSCKMPRKMGDIELSVRIWGNHCGHPRHTVS